MHKHQVAACKNLAFGTQLADAGEFFDFTGITMVIGEQVKTPGWFPAQFSNDAGLVVNFPDKLNKADSTGQRNTSVSREDSR
jgi:hypothetical protein